MNPTPTTELERRRPRVTGFVNLALKVSSLEDAREFFDRCGASCGEIEPWEGSRRCDVVLGETLITLFEKALYEDSVSLAEDCFLHAVFSVEDLDSALDALQSTGELNIVWGPGEVRGSFGHRRIAFLEAPGSIRIELMQQLEEPTREPGTSEGLGVTRVLHVSVNTTGKLEATKEFYEEIVGLPSIHRPEIPGVPGNWHQVGDVQLHLVGAPLSEEGIDPNAAHFCLGVVDIEEAVSWLEAQGVDYLRGVQNDRGRQVIQIWFRDPAGNVVELQEDRGIS
jgi:catechol 2,3-dioxygenase-like lactoylglutathione lyase family enzyme